MKWSKSYSSVFFWKGGKLPQLLAYVV